MTKAFPTSLLAGAVVALNASATLLFYESFDYLVGSDLASLGPSTESPDYYGEIDTDAFGSGTAEEIQIINGSVGGPSASPFATSGNAFSWGTSLWANGSAVLNTAISADATTDFYFSFLARASSTDSLLISFEISNGGNQRLQAGINGTSFFARSQDLSIESLDTAGTVSLNTTYFIVGKMSTGATDSISLTAFAPGDTVPLSEPVNWTTTASSSITGAERLSRIRYRAYGGIAGETILDEVRFGTTWEAVAIPEASVFGLFSGAFALGWILIGRRRP